MAWQPKQDTAHYTAKRRPKKKPKQWGTMDIKLQKWKFLFHSVHRQPTRKQMTDVKGL